MTGHQAELHICVRGMTGIPTPSELHTIIYRRIDTTIKLAVQNFHLPKKTSPTIAGAQNDLTLRQ